MTTKERIIDEALTLFSIYGYEGVSVKDIAHAVAIKDSSLYKHFKSKKAIFDTILEEMTAHMEGLAKSLALPDPENEDTSKFYGAISSDTLVDISKKAFLFYLKDNFIARFRRMLTIEQYHHSEVSGIYRKIFMEDSIDYQTMVFDQFIKAGVFIESDPEMLAVNFYAPIFFLLNRYDNQPEKETEALKILERHIREFSRIYTK